MKTTKRNISVLITLIILINIMICPATVSARKYDSFNYRIQNNEIIITGYEGKEIDLIIPSEIGGKKVVALDDYTFQSTKVHFKSIEIPSTVKSIGDNLYNEWDDFKLEKLILHEGLEKIGSEAFIGCEKLKNVKIPKSVNYIGSHAFAISDCDDMYYESLWYTNDFILDCYKGSEGEHYAKSTKLDYRLIDKDPDTIHQSINYCKIYNKQKKRDITLEYAYDKPTVNFFNKVYNYTGEQIKPVSYIKLYSPVTGKYYKVNKSNYEIQYKNNINVGFAKAIIRGKNNCYGKTIIEFRIGPQETKVKSVKNLGNGYINVKWNKTKKTTGYKIKYSTNKGKSYKTAAIVNNSDVTSHTIRLNTNKTYQIKVTPYYRVKKSRYPDKVFLNGYKKKNFNTINSGCKNKLKISL